MEFAIAEEREMKGIAKTLLNFAGDRRKMTFTGEVGVGKTTLIQYLCILLGVNEPVTSPTYALINQYQGFFEDQPCTINHLDLYRLKDLEECLAIGVEEVLYDESFCFIEWPELLEPILPEGTLKIRMDFIQNSSRKILFL